MIYGKRIFSKYRDVLKNNEFLIDTECKHEMDGDV